MGEAPSRVYDAAMRNLWPGLFISGLLLIGCESDEPLKFVGEVADTDARFGVVVDDEIGSFYVCGGDQDRERFHDWFDVTATEDGFTGTEPHGTVDFVIDGDVITGSVTVDDSTHAITGTRAQDVDGLYRPEEEAGACRVGVIVANGGSTVQGVFCPDLESAVQVVPIDLPETGLTADGFAVESASEPPVQFMMRPASVN